MFSPEPDPVKQAEDRDAAWERFKCSFPVCAICGEPILDDTRYYFQRRDEFICPDCVSYAREPNDPIEPECPESEED